MEVGVGDREMEGPSRVLVTGVWGAASSWLLFWAPPVALCYSGALSQAGPSSLTEEF